MVEYESLIHSQFMEKTRPATQAEIETWIDGATNNYDDTAIRHRHNIRFADQDFILPSLYGHHPGREREHFVNFHPIC